MRAHPGSRPGHIHQTQDFQGAGCALCHLSLHRTQAVASADTPHQLPWMGGARPSWPASEHRAEGPWVPRKARLGPGKLGCSGKRGALGSSRASSWSLGWLCSLAVAQPSPIQRAQGGTCEGQSTRAAHTPSVWRSDTGHLPQLNLSSAASEQPPLVTTGRAEAPTLHAVVNTPSSTAPAQLAVSGPRPVRSTSWGPGLPLRALAESPRPQWEAALATVTCSRVPLQTGPREQAPRGSLPCPITQGGPGSQRVPGSWCSPVEVLSPRAHP